MIVFGYRLPFLVSQAKESTKENDRLKIAVIEIRRCGPLVIHFNKFIGHF